MMFQEEKKEKSISPNIARSLTSHRISNAIDGESYTQSILSSIANVHHFRIFLVRIANTIMSL